MGSNLEFKNAIGYMDPMQVTDYLQKTLHFLESNNSEIMFPSISPYVETFLVNLVTDTRNLKSQALKPGDRTFAEKIIEVLEMSREVFRWTHAYVNGNLLVYKKIFSNKMKKKPIKLSAIADRLIQARASDLRQPRLPKPSIPPEPKNGIFTTGFKLRFLQTTLNFVKNDMDAELHYDEMPIGQAEYLYNLIKYRDKEVGFGYKSLYASLWEAMEEYGADYKFEVVLKETSNSKASLMLKKTPRNKSKDDDSPKNKKTVQQTNADETNMTKKSPKSSRSEKAKSYHQLVQSVSNTETSTLPSLDLISNISEKFFHDTIVTLTNFADGEYSASHTFSGLTVDELMFVRKVKKFAASTRIRESFEPRYRDLLWRLNYSINEAKNTCKITTSVNEAEGSISLRKTPLFASPAPVAQQSGATGARSKSVVSTKTRDRSLSRDRLIQFEKGGNIPATTDKQQEESGRGEGPQQEHEKGRGGEGLSKRKAKLLEDLSTPVESDIGMRMMLLMGWNGGALGARGEGIIEPVMPAIELPKRGGLGHVPPPKPEKKAPRRPIDFRLTLLHNIHDLLLHEELQKEIVFKEPISKKENSFIRHSLTSINNNTNIELTAKENDLVAAISKELKKTPGLIVRARVSGDLKAVTLQKLFDQPVKQPKPKTPKPKPVKLKTDIPQNIPDQDVSVVITTAEVNEVTEHIDVSDLTVPPTLKVCPVQTDIPKNIPDQDVSVVITNAEVNEVRAHVDVSDLTRPASDKLLRRRAIRLLLMMKFAKALSVEWQGQIVYKFEGTLPKRVKLFLKSIIEQLNGDAWLGNLLLLRGEHPVYEALMRGARGSLLSLDFRPMSKFVLTRVPLINEDNLNNDIIDLTQADSSNESDNNANITEDFDSQRFTPGIVKDENSNIDINMAESDENDNIIHRHDIENEGADNFRMNTIMENLENMKIDKEIEDECYNLIKSIENDQIKEVEVKKDSEFDVIDTNSNKETDNVINIENIKNDVVNFEDNTSACDVPELYGLDRDIQELAMTIMNAKTDYGSATKIELSSDISPDGDDSEIDLIMNVKQENDDSNISGKRSHSNSICSAELDPKKTKITIESDENLVIIAPKNPEENMTEDMIKEVQTVMSRELDKSGGFLPLLKCHGAQNGGLVYSCHDEEDVAWLENVISVANINLQIVPAKDLLLYKKNRELLIKINSFIPLDTKKTFRKLEIYNVGLDTKFWKVTHKHTTDSFVMLIVTVDEKSFKYISDEKFSLYCGIDKAQFSIIF